jgi:peptidoglycan/xylan/chitin deacetylase (PgdA/CDA1 family)
MHDKGVVFLMYHELEVPGRPMARNEPGYVRYVVRLPDFRSQMEMLQRQGWKGVGVGDTLGAFAEKTVAITFDDGCESDLLYAAPILREFNFGATFYITTGFLGKPGHLSQSQVRELSGMGFEIGCHSMTHPYLTDLNDTELHREVAEAKVQLEQILGTAVQHFSCPGGRYDKRVADMAVRAGYRSVATSRIAMNFRSSTPFDLARVAVMRSMSAATFGRLYQGNNLWKMRLQLQVREAVKKLLGNSSYDLLRSALLRRRSS